MPRLIDWTEHSDRQVRHFSGTALYETDIHLPAAMVGDRFHLDLGKVNHIAEAWLDDVPLGVAWTAPWTLPMGEVARAGRHRLRIAVTNVWANRLIGDEEYPSDCEWGPENDHWRAGRPLAMLPEWVHRGGVRPEPRRRGFATWNYFADRRPALAPSGLIGPVRILTDA